MAVMTIFKQIWWVSFSCKLFFFGWFPGVWFLIADVSELLIGSIFIGRWMKFLSASCEAQILTNQYKPKYSLPVTLTVYLIITAMQIFYVLYWLNMQTCIVLLSVATVLAYCRVWKQGSMLCCCSQIKYRCKCQHKVRPWNISCLNRVVVTGKTTRTHA